jgi:predicted nucleic acid-binding protein
LGILDPRVAPEQIGNAEPPAYAARCVSALLINLAMSPGVAPRKTLEVVKHDPPDNRILECAVEAGSQYVVSGDNDLLRVGKYGGTQIVKLADFLKVMQGKTEPAR